MNVIAISMWSILWHYTIMFYILNLQSYRTLLVACRDGYLRKNFHIKCIGKRERLMLDNVSRKHGWSRATSKGIIKTCINHVVALTLHYIWPAMFSCLKCKMNWNWSFSEFAVAVREQFALLIKLLAITIASIIFVAFLMQVFLLVIITALVMFLS